MPDQAVVKQKSDVLGILKRFSTAKALENATKLQEEEYSGCLFGVAKRARKF